MAGSIFDTSGQSQGQVAAPAQPTVVQPTQVQSTAQAVAPLVSSLVKTGASLFQGSTERRAEKASNASLANFSEQQLTLADAVDQGNISSQEARMRMRANFTQAVSDNPAMASDFAKLQKELLSTSGLGKVAAEGTPEEQAQLALEREATLNGWIKPDMTDAERGFASEDYAEFKKNIDDLALESKRVSLDTARINQTTAQITQGTSRISQKNAQLALAQTERKTKSQVALGNVANSFQKKLIGDFQAIQRQLDRGEITQEEAVILADQQWASLQTVTSQIGANAGADYVNNLTAPMKTVYNNFRGQFSGEISDKIAASQVNNAIATQKLLLLGDEKTAELVAISALLPNANLSTLPAVTAQVTRILNQNRNLDKKPADLLPDDNEGANDVSTYLNVLKENMTSISAKTAIDQQATEVDIATNVINVLKGIDAYSATTQSAQEYNQVVDFLASAEYGEYAKTEGGIPAEVASNAKQILQEQYESVVLDLVVKEYKDALVETGRTGFTPTTPGSDRAQPLFTTTEEAAENVIKPVFNGSGVVFTTLSDSPEAKRKARDLNRKVAPLLNRLIRTSSHLDGSTDYRATFANNFESLFLGGEAPQEQPAEGD